MVTHEYEREDESDPPVSTQSPQDIFTPKVIQNKDIIYGDIIQVTDQLLLNAL